MDDYHLAPMNWIVTVVVGLTQSPETVGNLHPQTWLLIALQWMEGLGWVGGLVFIALYIVATVAFLPGSILTLGAGVIFGVVLGSVYVFVGATLGAIAAFLVGRYLARGWVSHRLEGHANFGAIDQAVAREGFKMVLLTRLSPVFPFNLLNYAFGITGVSLKHYALGSIGMVPGTIVYVYLGSLVGDLSRLGGANPTPDSTLSWVFRLVGFLATGAATLYITRLARRALSQEMSPRP